MRPTPSSCYRLSCALLVAVVMVAGYGHALEQTESALTDIDRRELARTEVSWIAPTGGVGQAVKVRLVTFNDFHGQLEARAVINGQPGEPGRPAGGAAVLKAWIDSIVAEDPKHTILVAAGDQIGGSPPSSALLQDEPTFAFLNRLVRGTCPPLRRIAPSLQPQVSHCLALAAVGNHEFDEGTVELERLLYGGTHASGPFLQRHYPPTKLPFMAANVTRGPRQQALLPGSVIIEVGGVRVGFVAAVTADTPSLVPAGRVDDLHFLPEVASINAEVDKLKAVGVHAIVVVLHEGLRQYAAPTQAVLDTPEVRGRLVGLLRGLDPDVDAVVSGHTHQFTNALVRGSGPQPLLVTQAFMYGSAIGDVELLVSRDTGEVVGKRSRILTTWGDAGPGLQPDAKVAKEVAAAHRRVAAAVSRVIGTASAPITRGANRSGESAMGNLVADAQRLDAGAEIGLMNAGGLRADLDAGPITWEDLFSIQPFGNGVMRLRLTGAQLRRVLEQQWNPEDLPGHVDTGRMLKTSGFRYVWDGRLPWGAKIVSITLADGTPVQPATSYTVAASDFLVKGGDFFTGFAAGTDATLVRVDLEALVHWVEQVDGPVTARIENRILRLDP